MQCLSIQNHSPLPFEASNETTKKETPSSFICQVAQRSLDMLVAFIRIDRSITDFIYDPDLDTGIHLFAHLFQIGLVTSAICLLGTTFGIYAIAFSALILGIYNTCTEQHADAFRDFKQTHYFPLENALKNIAIGIVAVIPVLFLETLIVSALELLGLSLEGTQDVAVLLSSGGVMGVIWIIFGCILAPISEELLFRGWLTDRQLAIDHADPIDTSALKTDQSKIEVLRAKGAFSSSQLIKTALKTALMFALLHLNPFQGAFNLPIFLFTFTFSLFLSFLKETSGDLWAPTTVHLLNNVIATIQLRGGFG